MAIHGRDTLGRVGARRITAEDVLRPGGRWRDHEIWDGRPRVCEPSGGWAEAVGTRIVAPLHAHVTARNAGHVFMSSQGFLLARDPDRLLAPDGAYVSRERLPCIPPDGFIPLAPDFLIEVRSPDQAWEETVEKCGVWIAHGTSCAWAVDPTAQAVAVMRPGEAPEVVRRSGAVTAAPVLPDFRLEVASLFHGLAPR